MIKITNFLFLVMFFSIFSVSLSGDEEMERVSTKTAVVFNTLCAKCHEGQCSGRLSFDTGAEAADSHIRRYAGDTNISAGETKDFFTLLNYMKKKCALYMPDNGRWKPENLSHFALPSHDGYFIPLGAMKSGSYSLNIETKEHVVFRVEVMSEHLDSLLYESRCPDQEDQTFHFTIDEPVDAFLRIRSREPLHLTSLEIRKDEE
ncbi:MAG: hypothetical protein U9Q62_11225 [Campylobacterota bacterium]|nr:hypothetical protein [Campylobacterota bacterium]